MTRVCQLKNWDKDGLKTCAQLLRKEALGQNSYQMAIWSVIEISLSKFTLPPTRYIFMQSLLGLGDKEFGEMTIFYIF